MSNEQEKPHIRISNISDHIYIHESMINYMENFDQGQEKVSSIVTETSSLSSEMETKYFDDLTDVAGAWGINNFDRVPWSDNKKNMPKLRKFEDLVLDENEKAGVLSRKIISTCLSYLKRSPEDFKYALCKCVLSEKHLTDISVLERYQFLQYLDLSHNKLTTLSALGRLSYLQYLNASHNQLETLLDFKAPFFLTYAIFSENFISEIPDLSNFWSLTYLDLSYNTIRKIEGLQGLRYLTYLNMSYNDLRKLENLNNMNLQTLILSNNSIEEFEEGDNVGLATLCHVITIDLSNNKLMTLKLFKDIESVENIQMANNDISDLLTVYYLRNKRFLSRLDLRGNLVCNRAHYQDVCIRTIQTLRYLDEEEVTAEMRVLARSSRSIDHLRTRENRMELLLLQQLSTPKIGTHILPYDQPLPNIIVLVGTPASGKKNLVMKFVRSFKQLVLGVSHTTRPKEFTEVDGREYYFVNREQFEDLLRKGDFIAVSEFNGYLFGIAHEELVKAMNAVIVFHSDLNTALTLKLMGLHPKLVLALPRHEKTHMSWLQDRYHYYADLQMLCIQQNPNNPVPEEDRNNEETNSFPLEEISRDDTIDEASRTSDPENRTSDLQLDRKSEMLYKDLVLPESDQHIFNVEQDLQMLCIQHNPNNPVPEEDRNNEETNSFPAEETSRDDTIDEASRTSDPENRTSDLQLDRKSEMLYKDLVLPESDQHIFNVDQDLQMCIEQNPNNPVPEEDHDNEETDSFPAEETSRDDTIDEASRTSDPNNRTSDLQLDRKSEMLYKDLVLPESDQHIFNVEQDLQILRIQHRSNNLVPEEYQNDAAETNSIPSEGYLRDDVINEALLPLNPGSRGSDLQSDQRTQILYKSGDHIVFLPKSEQYVFSNEEYPKYNLENNRQHSGILKKETSILKEEDNQNNVNASGKDKRVSFDKQNNTECTHRNSTGSELRPFSYHKSISNTLFEHKDTPMLSALSSSQLVDNKGQQTVYMSLSERLLYEQMDKLGKFYLPIIDQRNELLELHWENPGLFRDVVFTDEEEESIAKLKGLLKFTIENYPSAKPIFSFDNDKSFKDMMEVKHKYLNIQKDKYVKK